MATYQELSTVISLKEALKMHAFLDLRDDMDKHDEHEMNKKNGS
tara:strand:+ start:604 stop:735 length:132 start_codon:yes stop_codon:yes gene_type:complete